jgi:hypothetical protein
VGTAPRLPSFRVGLQMCRRACSPLLSLVSLRERDATISISWHLWSTTNEERDGLNREDSAWSHWPVGSNDGVIRLLSKWPIIRSPRTIFPTKCTHTSTPCTARRHLIHQSFQCASRYRNGSRNVDTEMEAGNVNGSLVTASEQKGLDDDVSHPVGDGKEVA